MADIAERLLSDMSKVQGSSKGRSSAKSRAKQENRQQAQVLMNFANALGNKAISVFSKKMKSLERSMTSSKSMNQRVTIKAAYSIEKNAAKATKLLREHIRYVCRESAGESKPFNSDEIILSKDDLKSFVIGTPKENEKEFRFIISPEKAKNFESDEHFKKYIQDCMNQLSKDLPGNPKLNYVARIHYDTDNPHCHVLLKGLSKTGQDITIPKEYLKTTFREKTEGIATYYLGTRTLQDIQDAKLSEITAKRLTSLDFDILRVSAESSKLQLVDKSAPVTNIFNTKDYDRATKSQEYRLVNFIIPRLDYLCKIGLATKNKTKYTLDPDYKNILQEMPLNNDIIKKLAALKKTHFITSSAKYDPYIENKPITGIVIEKDYYNEDKALTYVIILDSNKKTHFVKLNKNSEVEGNETSVGNTVELTTKAYTSKTGPKAGQEQRFPTLKVLSRLSLQEQVNHPGITDLDKNISLNDFIQNDPNVYQKQLQDAIQPRIDKLMSEKKLYCIEGKYRFSKTYWLDAEKAEHSSLEQNFKNLTYYRLSEKETFQGRFVATKQFGNETHAIISNGKQFIIIPVRGRINNYNDKTTILDITMQFERKGYSSPVYNVKPLIQTIKGPTQKV